jgi:hypothetical protein
MPKFATDGDNLFAQISFQLIQDYANNLAVDDEPAILRSAVLPHLFKRVHLPCRHHGQTSFFQDFKKLDC